MTVQREQLEADVLIVGAGPAGLSCALHLANLIKNHNDSGAKPPLSAENIYVLEKGREIGAHQLSGAIMNPKALAELVPEFEKSAPSTRPSPIPRLSSSPKLLVPFSCHSRHSKTKATHVISLSKLSRNG
jgi:electron-transferring-flavoprotein dehydrogenase